MIAAIENGDSEAVAFLLKTNPVLLEQPKQDQHPPLHDVIQENRLDLAGMLFGKGPILNRRGIVAGIPSRTYRCVCRESGGCNPVLSSWSRCPITQIPIHKVAS